jgi:hypothetical protein
MVNELFKATPTTMSEAKFEFGNAQGLSIADRLARLEDQLNNLSSEVTALKPYFEAILTVRSAILDQETGIGEFKPKCNAIAHGGNVIVDLEAINHISVDPSTAARWRTSFTTYYKVPYTFVKDHLPQAPREVIESLNLRMDIKVLHMWSDPQKQFPNLTGTDIKFIRDKRAQVEKACDAVIDEWYKSLLDRKPVWLASPKMEASFRHIASIRKECSPIFYRGKNPFDSLT